MTAAKLDVARIRPKLQEAAPDALPRIGHLIETLNSGIALKRRIELMLALPLAGLDAMSLQHELKNIGTS